MGPKYGWSFYSVTFIKQKLTHIGKFTGLFRSNYISSSIPEPEVVKIKCCHCKVMYSDIFHA